MSSLPMKSPANTAGRRYRSAWSRLVHAVGIVRLVWFACALSSMVLLSTALLAYRADQKQFNNALDTRVSLVARSYAKFVTLHFAVVDRELKLLREQRLEGGRLPAQAAINKSLPELNGLVLQIAVADADGLIVDSSLGLPNQSVNIADRPHFRAVKNNPQDQLFISEPVLGRVSKKLSLQLVRPMLADDGKFLGAIVASIDPELLKTFFTDIKALENDGRLTIIGLDGIVRFRLTSQGFSAGDSVLASPLWGQVSTLAAGIIEAASPIDGITRRSGFHRLEGYPLVVVVGIGLVQQRQSLQARWNLIWSLALALAVLLVIVAATIARLAKEQTHSLRLLEQNRLRALESSRTKSNFLASVSHELRTPLNSILGFSELIRDTSTDPRTSQFAGLIHKSGSHLHALVNTILDLTKIESGKMGLTLEPIELPELLQTLVAIHKVNADEKNVELSLSVDGLVQGPVTSDRTKLVQVLNNVIHNAIKFTPAGAIFVVLKPAGAAGVLISVIDTGIGIAASDIGQVFERFNTIEAPIDAAGEKGSGLGLALSRELLGLMDGTISLSSEAGQGTSVEIFIPYTVAGQGETA
jgi:signal transduction histidine kinase